MPHWKRVAPGIYTQTKTGAFYERPHVNGRRTFRRLRAWNLKLAKEELAARRTDQTRAAIHHLPDPYTVPKTRTFADVLHLWTKAGYPNAAGKLPGERHLAEQQRRATLLATLHGKRTALEITPQWAATHARTRQKDRPRPRAVDLEIATAATALAWATRTGLLPRNPLPSFTRSWDPQKVKHSRERMPENATILHTLADAIREDGTDATADLCLFLAYSGCRTSEALRCRWDARTRFEAGFIDGEYLWIQRAKGGCNPFVLLHPPLRVLLETMRTRSKNWFFPSPTTKGPLGPTALRQALARLSKLLQIPHVSPHGLRAYYVTVRRSQGISDGQIAAEIGDRTGPTIIATTYGDIPPNWKGSPGLTFEP